MAKVDWPKAIAKWERDHEATGIKLKAWCEENAVVYNTMRRNINTYRDQKGDQKKEMITKNDHSQSDQKQKRSQTKQAVKGKTTAKRDQKTTKRTSDRKQGGQIGNQNAKVHGFFGKHFKEAWDIAGHFTQDVRTNVVNAQAVETIEVRSKYQEDLEAIQEAVGDKQPTEDEFDRMNKLGELIGSCNRTITRLMKMGSSLDLDAINMSYTRTRDEHKRVDMRLKEKNIILAEANAKKSRAQTDLGIAQLKALDKDEGGKKDDLDEILDEIMDTRDGLMSEMPGVDEDV